MRKLFVSSTFKDMQAERDALRDYVSAQINAQARQHGDEIEFCDLRWGIDTSGMEEEESSRKVLNVCFREIDRCETPFIILLGYRYGWIPDAETVRKATDEVKMELDQLEKSVTALEIEYGSVLKQKKTLVYERVIVNEEYPQIYHSEDSGHQKKLEELKQRIRNLTDSKISTYEVHFRKGKPLEADIRSFADMVFHDLAELMKPDWDRYDALPQVQKKQMAAWNYIREKGKLFTARTHDAEKCLELLENGNEQVLVCMGDPGSGKSTLASHLALTLKDRAHVIPIIGGLTPEDTDSFAIIRKSVEFLENLLERPCDDIREETGETDEYKAYEVRMRELAAFLPEEEALYIIVDALDQFNDSRYRDRLGFIPKSLPRNVRYFITCTKDLRLPDTAVYVPDGLSTEDRKLIIGSVLERAGKELHGSVKDEINQMKGSDQPLYISLMMQRLMIMNRSDFNAIDSAGTEPNEAIAAQQKKIIHDSSENLSELAAQVLTDVARRINPALCIQILQFIAVSRYGLRPSDLALLCKETWKAADFALLVHSLSDDFIVRDDGRYDFMHKSIRTGIRNTLNKTEFITVDQKILKTLQALPQNDPVREAELIYHMLRCRAFSQVFSYMEYRTDPEDEAYRKAARAVYDFMIDYSNENVRALVKQAESEKAWEGTMRMLSEGVPRLFDGESSSCSIMCDVLIDIYNTVNKKGKNLDAKKDILSYCAENIAKLGEWAGRSNDCRTYTKRYLNYAKQNLNTAKMHERISLIKSYYIAMQAHRESTDEKELADAIRIGEEGKWYFNEKAAEYLLSQNERIYVTYDYILAYIYSRAKEPLKAAEARNRFRVRSDRLYEKHPTKLNAYTRDLFAHSAASAMLAEMDRSYERKEDGINSILEVYKETLKTVQAMENHELNVFPAQLSDLILDYEHLATCKEVFSSQYGGTADSREMIAWNVKAIDAGIRLLNRTGAAKDMTVLMDNLDSYVRRLAENPSGLEEAEAHLIRWQNECFQNLKINSSAVNYKIAAHAANAYADIFSLKRATPGSFDNIYRSVDVLAEGIKGHADIVADIDKIYRQCSIADSSNPKTYDRWLEFSQRFGNKGSTLSSEILMRAFNYFRNASDPLGKARALRYGKRLIELKSAEFEKNKTAAVFGELIRSEVSMADLIETLDFFHPLREKYIRHAVQAVNNNKRTIILKKELSDELEWQKIRLPSEKKYSRRNLQEFIRLYRLGKSTGAEKLSDYLIYHQVFVPADQTGNIKEIFSSPVDLLLRQLDTSMNPAYEKFFLGDLLNRSANIELVLDPGTAHQAVIGHDFQLNIREKHDELLKAPSPEQKMKLLQSVRKTIRENQIRHFRILGSGSSKTRLIGQYHDGKLRGEEPLAYYPGKVMRLGGTERNGVLFTYRGMYSSFWADRLIRYDEIQDYSQKKGKVILELKNDFEVVIEAGEPADEICQILGSVLETVGIRQ